MQWALYDIPRGKTRHCPSKSSKLSLQILILGDSHHCYPPVKTLVGTVPLCLPMIYTTHQMKKEEDIAADKMWPPTGVNSSQLSTFILLMAWILVAVTQSSIIDVIRKKSHCKLIGWSVHTP